jgi:hypothetical protein
MASTFTLTLDTTAPQGATLTLSAGAAYTASTAATADFATSDADTTGYQVKVWGELSGGPATEGAASWQSYSASIAITLSTGDGLKTVSGKIRDDVGNETAVLTNTITLDTTSPVPTISVAFAPTKISKITGFDASTGSFQSDTAIQAWKFKVVPATDSVHTAGTTIPTTGGSQNTTGGALAITTNQSVTIVGADLETASSGDGPKIVKVFVQDLAGSWSL